MIGQALMIVDWTALPTIQARWKGNVVLLNDAIIALYSAISQADVRLSLCPPVYDISPDQPPIEYRVAASRVDMLGYSIVELPTSADVTLYHV